MPTELIKIEEPELVFGNEQSLEDPRDGLTLFGPLNENAPFGVNYGIIGTKAGIERFYRWIGKVNDLLPHDVVSKRTLWVPFQVLKQHLEFLLLRKLSLPILLIQKD